MEEAERRAREIEQKIIKEQEERGYIKCRHGIKDWSGANPQCAFFEDGTFNPNNWSCILMSKVRFLCSQWNENAPGFNLWHDDDYIGVIPIRDETYESYLSGRFAILNWYKSRGRTDGFWILDSSEMRSGTEKDAEEIVRLFQKELEEYD